MERFFYCLVLCYGGLSSMSVEVELEESVGYTPIQRMRHSAAHVMAEAVQEIFPDARFGIGPAIEDGFYYDFELPRALTPDDLPDIEKRMARRRKSTYAAAAVRHGVVHERGARTVPVAPGRGAETRSPQTGTRAQALRPERRLACWRADVSAAW